jgi:hypothetical protein
MEYLFYSFIHFQNRLSFRVAGQRRNQAPPRLTIFRLCMNLCWRQTQTFAQPISLVKPAGPSFSSGLDKQNLSNSPVFWHSQHMPNHRSCDFFSQSSSDSRFRVSQTWTLLTLLRLVMPKILFRNRISAACTRHLVLSARTQAS